MQLTAAKRKQLHQALLSAFPTWPALEQMASFELNVNLATVAPETDLQNTVLRLITWAEAKDRVPDLTRAALKANPTNLKLQAVAQGLSAKKPVRPRSSSTRSRVRSSDV